MAQQLTIIGDAMQCGQRGCDNDATVMLRQINEDESRDCILYCDLCWLAFRRAYTPLTAHDATQAIIGLSDTREPPHGENVEVPS
jgi:hypothetical protein